MDRETEKKIHMLRKNNTETKLKSCLNTDNWTHAMTQMLTKTVPARVQHKDFLDSHKGPVIQLFVTHFDKKTLH